MSRALAWLRAHWAAIASALTTLAGILADPDMLGLLPAKYAHALAATGVVLQLLSRAIRALPVEDSPHA